jgi:ABC-type spermidine/putrescine transport system permease subunit I
VKPRSGTKRGLSATWLLVPGLLALALLLLAPLVNLFYQSLQTFVSGDVGADSNAGLTLQNYADLLRAAYALYIADTFRISLIATVISVTAGFLVAFRIARARHALSRKLWLALIVAMLFLSSAVRVYSINLLFSPGAVLRKFLMLIGIAPNGGYASEIMVVVGMVNQLLPIAVLTLVATIQNVNPRLAEAAQALGASRTKAHLTVTVPLCRRGLIGTFLLTYTLSLSSFVVPMVLGRGQVIFVSNLIYARFADVSNYPSGGALSISLLLISLIIVVLTARVASRRWDVN